MTPVAARERNGCAAQPLAFAGVAALDGCNLVRVAYLDESGVGKINDDPIVVVAGVIVHPDKQWLSLQSYLHSMADQYAPAEARRNFTFHATELFHGGKNFPRSMEMEARWRILDELCSIPGKFDLPVVCGCFDRRSFEDQAGFSARDQVGFCQMMAAMSATLGVEKYMRQVDDQSEVAVIVYEDNDHAKKVIRGMHNYMRDDFRGEFFGKTEWQYLPLTKIVETAHFAAKTDSSLLQIADACAFAIKRNIQKAFAHERFFTPLAKNLVMRPVVQKVIRQRRQKGQPD
jgi:hypothetical protein